MKKVIVKEFFHRPVLEVAPDLLGRFLVRRYRGEEIASMIIEIEAYDGPHDLACHGRFGRTQRNKPLFDKPGTIYMYFIYGMYWMLNIVTCEKEYPAAVLLRGVTDVSGPGRLTRHFHLDKRFNHQSLGKEIGLWIEDRGVIVPKRNIQKTPRIGVDCAGVWAKKPYRFVLKDL